jgi:CRP-like cAMP-binding protein
VTNRELGAGGEAPLDALVAKLSYWQKLDSADRNAIRSLPHSVKPLSRGHYIVRDGDRVKHSCMMLNGYSARQKIVAGGRRQIVAIHIRGELVDLQNALLKTADHSVQMISDGAVAMIPSEALEQLAFERPTVGRAMWIDTLVDGAIFREWVANVGQRDAKTRVAHLLCEFALRLKVAGLGEAAGYQLPMTQEQLGDATGLTAVHVNRTIKALEADGLIERVSPRVISIGDWHKLAAAGDFDSGYLHLPEGVPALA